MPGVAVQGSAIAFAELAGVGGRASPVISCGREARSVVREGIIAWTNIDSLLAELFPDPPALPGQYPGVTYLYVKDVEFVPFPDVPPQGHLAYSGSGVLTYLYAKATIAYDTLKFDPVDLIARRRSFSVQTITLPDYALYWESDGAELKVPDVQAIKNVPVIEHHITLYRSTSYNATTVQANIGKINDGTFEGADDETLMFVGSDSDFVVGTRGVQTFTNTFVFHERRIQTPAGVKGWNYFWRPDSAIWDKVVDTGGDPIYQKVTTFGDLY